MSQAPQASSSDTCILLWLCNYMVFKWSHRPKAGRTGKELGPCPSRLCCFASPSKNQQRTRKQETKKTEKENRNQKKKIAHPKGGSSGRELGLVILCFFWGFLFFCFFFWFCFFGFLVFWFFGFWFCLAIAEKPSRNCQWLQSSGRTIAHVQCQWLQNAVKNRTPRVSPSEPSEKKKSKDNKTEPSTEFTVHLIMQIKQTRVLYVRNIVWDN